MRLIEQKFPRVSPKVFVGIGDDAAAISPSPTMLILATTDSHVEDRHFLANLITPRLLARRALAASISDIGAMGGVPLYFLSTIGFSERTDELWLDELLAGFEEAQGEFGVELIGGNLTSSASIFIDITSIGEVEPERLVRRRGASPGEGVFVSGTLGDSALGLTLLAKGVGPKRKGTEEEENLIRRHILPTPRLSLGRELARAGIPTAMIDVSDGLILDLGRITEPFGLGADVIADEIPLSPDYVCLMGRDYRFALSGGEDYELLFTAPINLEGEIRAIADANEVGVALIGTVTGGGGVRVHTREGSEVRVDVSGYVHKSAPLQGRYTKGVKAPLKK